MRKQTRELCFSRALMNNIPGQLRDITSSGFKIVFLQQPGAEINTLQTIGILPDESLEIHKMSIDAVIKWKEEDPYGTLIGFEIQNFSSKEDQKNYSLLLNYYE